MDILSYISPYLTTSNFITLIIALAVIGLFIEVFDVFIPRFGQLKEIVFLGSVATIALGYFAAKSISPELKVWQYIAGAVVVSAAVYVINTWYRVHKASKQLINAENGSIYQKIERVFDKYAGFATRVQREEYIKNVVDFLRGRELISWKKLVAETEATFAETLNTKNRHNELCYTSEALTTMFVSDVLSHLVAITNEDNPLFVQIQPIWEVRNAQATKSFNNLIQRPSVPWLELNFDLSYFYLDLITFVFLWPALLAKNTRKMFEASIKAIFKSSAEKRLEYLR